MIVRPAVLLAECLAEPGLLVSRKVGADELGVAVPELRRDAVSHSLTGKGEKGRGTGRHLLSDIANELIADSGIA